MIKGIPILKAIEIMKMFGGGSIGREDMTEAINATLERNGKKGGVSVGQVDGLTGAGILKVEKSDKGDQRIPINQLERAVQAVEIKREHPKWGLDSVLWLLRKKDREAMQAYEDEKMGRRK